MSAIQHFKGHHLLFSDDHTILSNRLSVGYSSMHQLAVSPVQAKPSVVLQHGQTACLRLAFLCTRLPTLYFVLTAATGIL